jgi:hypothetical protein
MAKKISNKEQKERKALRRIMQFYQSELIASILVFLVSPTDIISFPTSSCLLVYSYSLFFRHKTTARIKDGSFVLIDVESRSFVCFNFCIFNQLLLRFWISIKNDVNHVHAQSLSLVVLLQVSIAGLLQFR